MVENNASTNSPAMIRFCLIPARQTGIASLCMQLVGLVMSAVLTLHLLIHLNGITITRNIKQQSKLPASANNVTLFNITTMKSTEVVDHMNLTEKITWNQNSAPAVIENDTRIFGEIESQLYLTELIQISTIVYAGMCILWLFSLTSLLASIKLESLDLIIMNSVLLTIVMIYAIIHALFVSILFMYYTQIPWTTLAITSAIVVGFSLTSIICGFALAFNTIWYKYVAYVNDNDQCLCIPLTAHLFKRHGQRRPIQGYSIPEVTRHPNLPYDNELVVNNFSRL